MSFLLKPHLLGEQLLDQLHSKSLKKVTSPLFLERLRLPSTTPTFLSASRPTSTESILSPIMESNPTAEYSSFVDRISSTTTKAPMNLQGLEAIFSSMPVPFDVLTHPNSNVAVEEFRASQFHYTELSVLFLVGLYLIVFIVGTIGNTLILLWIKKEKAENSLFNPFLINLCLSDHLVLITCCPLMVYTKVTSLWFLGSFACTFFHYIQGKLNFFIEITLSVLGSQYI